MTHTHPDKAPLDDKPHGRQEQPTTEGSTGPPRGQRRQPWRGNPGEKLGSPGRRMAVAKGGGSTRGHNTREGRGVRHNDGQGRAKNDKHQDSHPPEQTNPQPEDAPPAVAQEQNHAGGSAVSSEERIPARRKQEKPTLHQGHVLVRGSQWRGPKRTRMGPKRGRTYHPMMNQGEDAGYPRTRTGHTDSPPAPRHAPGNTYPPEDLRLFFEGCREKLMTRGSPGEPVRGESAVRAKERAEGERRDRPGEDGNPQRQKNQDETQGSTRGMVQRTQRKAGQDNSQGWTKTQETEPGFAPRQTLRMANTTIQVQPPAGSASFPRRTERTATQRETRRKTVPDPRR